MPCSQTPEALTNSTCYHEFVSFVFRYLDRVNHFISHLRGSITSIILYGLSISLFTLNSCCHLHKLKTRYWMHQVLLSSEDFHLQLISASWRTDVQVFFKLLIYCRHCEPRFLRRGNPEYYYCWIASLRSQ